MSLPAPRDVHPDGLAARDLASVLPSNASVSHSGHLCVAGVDLVDLAHELGTPLYIYDEQDMRDRMRAFRSAMDSHAPAGGVPIYAGKAFLCKAMARVVDEEGLMLDVSGGGELAIALAAGFPAERVVVHGNNKTPRELREAIEARVGRIVVDSFDELRRISSIALEVGVDQDVLLRVTPGVVVDTNDYITTGMEDSKFGFTLRDDVAFRAVQETLEAPGVTLRGLHMHVGSQVLDISPYSRAVDVIVNLMARVRDELDVTLDELDAGGGLGVAYQTGDAARSPEAFVSLVSDALRSSCSARDLPCPRLYVEPGRSVVSPAGVALYTVGTIKELPGIRTFVAVDGGMSDNIRTALYHADYECLVADRANEPRTCVVTVAGKHCESGDAVALDASLQEPHVGDVLAVLVTGAYCVSMSSNYNGQPRPAVAFLRDGQARVVLRRETYDDLMRRDM